MEPPLVGRTEASVQLRFLTRAQLNAIGCYPRLIKQRSQSRWHLSEPTLGREKVRSCSFLAVPPDVPSTRPQPPARADRPIDISGRSCCIPARTGLSDCEAARARRGGPQSGRHGALGLAHRGVVRRRRGIPSRRLCPGEIDYGEGPQRSCPRIRTRILVILLLRVH